MAQIELRHANIRFVDGYKNTAFVNEASIAPAAGDTTLVIDTLGTPGIIPVSCRFSIVNVDFRYTVVAENGYEIQAIGLGAPSAGTFTLTFTGTLAAPVSITTAAIAFNATPAVVQAALVTAGISATDVVISGVADSYVATFQGQYLDKAMGLFAIGSGSLTGGTPTVTRTETGGSTWEVTFSPGFSTANGIPVDDAAVTFTGRTLEVNVGDGTLTHTEKKNYQYVLDRGNLHTVRQLDQAPLEAKLDMVWEFLTAIPGSVTPTPEDCLKNQGGAASWVTSSADPCEPYAIDIEIEYIPPCGGSDMEIITLVDYRYESLDHNIKDATIVTSGKCNIEAANIVRVPGVGVVVPDLVQV